MWAHLIAILLGPVVRATHQVLDHDARLVLTPRFGGFDLVPPGLAAGSAGCRAKRIH